MDVSDPITTMLPSSPPTPAPPRPRLHCQELHALVPSSSPLHPVSFVITLPISFTIVVLLIKSLHCRQILHYDTIRFTTSLSSSSPLQYDELHQHYHHYYQCSIFTSLHLLPLQPTPKVPLPRWHHYQYLPNHYACDPIFIKVVRMTGQLLDVLLQGVRGTIRQWIKP